MILYFSATGNSRCVARRLGERLGERVADLRTCGEVRLADGECLGFVFPIHCWGIPPTVAELIRRLSTTGSAAYCFMVATCGDDTGLSAREWAALMAEKGLTADAQFSVQMPNTYVLLPGFDVDSPALEARKLETMPSRVDTIADLVRNRFRGDLTHHGRFALLKSKVIRPGFIKRISDKKFHVDDSCRGCSRCAANCPVGNIEIVDNRPRWKGNCINCLACYHTCSHHAIAYGKATARKGQYNKMLKQNNI
ncbi:MAG: EFR1 family ferrodoxin [Candidatus Limisoma sp.]